MNNLNIATIDKVDELYEVNVSITPTYMASEKRTKTCEFLGEYTSIENAKIAISNFFKNDEYEIIID